MLPSNRRIEAMSKELQELRSRRGGGLAPKPESLTDSHPQTTGSGAETPADDFEPGDEPFVLDSLAVPGDVAADSFRL